MVLDAIHGRMTSVLYLNPVRRTAAAVRPVLVLRDKAFQPQLTDLPEQVGADLAPHHARPNLKGGLAIAMNPA